MVTFLLLLALGVAATVASFKLFAPFVTDDEDDPGRSLRVLAAGIVGIVVILLAGVAFAQGAMPPPATPEALLTEIIERVRPAIVEVATLIITFLAAWVAARFSARTGIEIERSDRDALQSALRNAATAGGNALDMITYVRKSVPDAIRRFGLDDDRIIGLLKPHVARRDTAG